MIVMSRIKNLKKKQTRLDYTACGKIRGQLPVSCVSLDGLRKRENMYWEFLLLGYDSFFHKS